MLAQRVVWLFMFSASVYQVFIPALPGRASIVPPLPPPPALEDHLSSKRPTADAPPLKLTFTDSPIFTPAIKQQIAVNMGRFRAYLHDLQIDAPLVIPRIRTAQGFGAATSYNPDLFTGDMNISTGNISDKAVHTWIYGYYSLTTLFCPSIGSGGFTDSSSLEFIQEVALRHLAPYLN